MHQAFIICIFIFHCLPIYNEDDELRLNIRIDTKLLNNDKLYDESSSIISITSEGQNFRTTKKERKEKKHKLFVLIHGKRTRYNLKWGNRIEVDFGSYLGLNL